MATRSDSELEDTARLCRHNALHVVSLAWTTHPHIGFDAAGVRWLDIYIERCRPALEPNMMSEFVQLMGCFYGECLIATFAGRWERSGNQLGVRTEQGLTYPFNAISRHLRQGESASIAVGYLTAVEYLRTAA